MQRENTRPETRTANKTALPADPLDDWRNELHCGDAQELLVELPNASIDCVVTSPPYWGLRDYGKTNQLGFENSREEYVNQLQNVFQELQHVLKPDGCVFLSIADQYQSTAPGTQNTPSNLNEKTSQAQGSQYRFDSGLPAKSLMLLPELLLTALLDDGWVLRNKIVWEKPNPMPEPSAVDRFTQSWEPIYFLTKNSQYQFDDAFACEHDRWVVPTSNTRTNHPAPFSEKLCTRAIQAACPNEGVVLDPFVGSGSTCVAAKKLGRDFIGFDLNEDYLAEAQKRVGTTVRTRQSTKSEITDSTHPSQHRLDMWTNPE